MKKHLPLILGSFAYAGAAWSQPQPFLNLKMLVAACQGCDQGSTQESGASGFGRASAVTCSDQLDLHSEQTMTLSGGARPAPKGGDMCFVLPGSPDLDRTSPQIKLSATAVQAEGCELATESFSSGAEEASAEQLMADDREPPFTEITAYSLLPLPAEDFRTAYLSGDEITTACNVGNTRNVAANGANGMLAFDRSWGPIQLSAEERWWQPDELILKTLSVMALGPRVHLPTHPVALDRLGQKLGAVLMDVEVVRGWRLRHPAVFLASQPKSGSVLAKLGLARWDILFRINSTKIPNAPELNVCLDRILGKLRRSGTSLAVSLLVRRLFQTHTVPNDIYAKTSRMRVSVDADPS